MHMSQTTTAEQVESELLALFDVVVRPSDRIILLPTIVWLENFEEVCKAECDKRKAEIESVRADGSVNEASDCDDFADIEKRLGQQARDRNPLAMKNGWGYAVYKARITISENEIVNGIKGDGRTQHVTGLVGTPDGWMLSEPQTAMHELAAVASDRCWLDTADCL